MNWNHYDKLVAHLQALPPTNGFTYARNRPRGNDDGCLTCHAQWLSSGRWPYEETVGPDRISDYLGISCGKELEYLYGREDRQVDPLCNNRGDMFHQGVGPVGIQEALRRLAVVAAKYERPVAVEPEPVAWAPDEAAFLAALRALVARPQAAVEEALVGAAQ